jgi:hypothetical protein
MDWLWRGYLAPGQLTLLTSLWKSGKTTLLATLLSRLRSGGELLGLPVRAARALVLSEETLELWQTRARRLTFAKDLAIISRPFTAKPTDAQWQTLLEHAGTALGPEGGRLLVIDTVATLLPRAAESNADCMVRALAPLRQLAEQGVAIWLMHHPPKGKPLTGQFSRGTGALPGTVDIVLEMHRLRDDDLGDRRRILRAASRHEETPRRLVFEWTPDGTDYRVLAQQPDDDFDRAWTLLSRVLWGFQEPLTAAEILRCWPPDAPPPSRATLHRWLAGAVDRGLLACEATTRRNAPYRYCLAGVD